MSLKSLIQRLLDSRTTPEEAGHSAMPQEDQVITFGSRHQWGVNTNLQTGGALC
jgi:hypothetical protein|nr:MAG TPA: hypothetical protein [Caudoviricetes sp.]